MNPFKLRLRSFISLFYCLNSLLWALLILLLSFSILSADNEKLIRVGVYDNKPKIFMNQERQKAEGILIDILELIAKKEDWHIEYVYGSWNDLLEMLKNGEIDLMPDVAYNSERALIYSFHQVPVLSAWSEVFCRKELKIQSILDLKDKKVAVLDGSVQQKAFEGFIKGFEINIIMIPFNNLDDAFNSLVQNKADAVIANNFYGAMNAAKQGFKDTGIVFNPASLYYATKLNRKTDLLTTIDKHLKLLKENPQSDYYHIIDKWTSEKTVFKLPLWIKVSIGAVLIIFFLIVILAFVLKRQVRLRTLELQKSYDEMEHKVTERTRDLAEAMEKAQQADQLKSAFLATMSHELRTPLNSIIGFTGILLQGLAGHLNDEQHKQLSMVQKSARHLLSLINDVLDISKIEAGQLELELTSFNLQASIEKLIHLVTPVTDKKNVTIHLDIASIIKEIYADQRRFEQILLNLLSNAAKFTSEGKIDVKVWKVENRLMFSVTDSGIGIDEESLNKLFKPFSQVDTGLSRKYEGTGLGLSICKKLLEIMGGDITVKSIPGQGSSFVFWIPEKKELRNE